MLVSSLWFASAHRPHFLSSGCGTKVYVLFQAAKDVSTSHDALVDLFDCIGNFLKCLEIQRSFTPSIAVKVLVELLSVLALATKQIKMGRLSKYILMRYPFYSMVG